MANETTRALEVIGQSLASLIESGSASGMGPGEKVVGTLYVPISSRLQEAIGTLAFHPRLDYGGSPQSLVRHAIAAWCYALTVALDDHAVELGELRTALSWDLRMAQLARRRRREELYADFMAASGSQLRTLIANNRVQEVDTLVNEAIHLAASAPVSMRTALEHRCANDNALQYAVSWLMTKGVDALHRQHWIEVRLAHKEEGGEL